MTATTSLPVLADSSLAQWYAIQTRYRYERKVTAHLQQKGIQVFLPLCEETHRWSDRRQTVSAPMFSGYTFACLKLFPRHSMDWLRTEGIIGPVVFGGEPAPIPFKQIEDLQRLLSSTTPCSLHAFLKIGQQVRIRGGCLDGVEGILERSGSRNLLISIESIQRSIAITIEGYELEMI
jgi:transcription antitermination factor NusG